MTLQNDDFFFWICGQLMRHPLIKLFHLSNLDREAWRAAAHGAAKVGHD